MEGDKREEQKGNIMEMESNNYELLFADDEVLLIKFEGKLYGFSDEFLQEY